MAARWTIVGGWALVAIGVLASLVPQFVPGAGGEPFFVGTYWYVGIPLIVAGVGILVWDKRRRSKPAAPPPEGS